MGIRHRVDRATTRTSARDCLSLRNVGLGARVMLLLLLPLSALLLFTGIASWQRLQDARELRQFQVAVQAGHQVARAADAIARERDLAVRAHLAPTLNGSAASREAQQTSGRLLSHLAAQHATQVDGHDVAGRADAAQRQLISLRLRMPSLDNLTAQSEYSQVVETLLAIERDLLAGSTARRPANASSAYLAVRAAVEAADRERVESWALLYGPATERSRSGGNGRWALLEAAHLDAYRSAASTAEEAQLKATLFRPEGLQVRRLRATIPTALAQDKGRQLAAPWWDASSKRIAALNTVQTTARDTLSRLISTELRGARTVRTRTIALSVGVLIAVIALGLLLRRSIATSLTEIINAARALAAGDLRVDIRRQGHDEIAAVGDAFRGIHQTNRRLVDELRAMNAAIARVDLDHRADPTTFDGAWAEVLDGMNGTMVEVARLHGAAEREVERQRAFGIVGREVVSGIAVSEAFARCAQLIVDHVGALRVEIYEQRDDRWRRQFLVGPPTAPLPPAPNVLDSGPRESPRADVSVAVSCSLGDPNRPAGALVVEFDQARHVEPGDLLFLDGVARLLSEALRRRESENQMRYQALHDPLTGLPNRTMFQEHLCHALRQTSGADEVAVLFLDLDAFKIVNDSLGHTLGDELLVGVSRRLTGAVRGGDLVARLGGDEFVVVTKRLGSHDDAIALARHLLDSLRAPFVIGDREIYATVSIGIAFSASPKTSSADTLLQQADTAMYRAKRTGGGRAEQFDDALRTTVVRRMDLEHRLRTAVQNHALDVMFQPLVDLRTRQPIGFEALSRWTDPQIGSVPPDEFIVIAEETQLIVDLGLDVLRTSCARFSDFLTETHRARDMKIAVNVSVRQLQHPGFVNELLALRKLYGLRPHELSVELTESVLLDDSSIVRAAMADLQTADVPIAIDDFGTGYSSFAYLTQLPISVLKIDRSLVAPLGTAPSHRAVVGAIIEMARHLGIKVVAEGVEHEHQAVALTDLGCDIGQGWLFGRPAPMPGARKPHGTAGS